MSRTTINIFLISSIIAVLFLSHNILTKIEYKHDYERVLAENHQLRMVNARRARFKDLEAGSPAEVNMEAVTNASFDMGTPASILKAVRRFENGPEGYELGNKAKTELFVKSVPLSHEQYYEASRSLNRIVWKYALSDRTARKKLFKALSEYTRPDHAAVWADGVEKFESQENPQPKKGKKK